MPRNFKGKVSELLYNDKLYETYQTIKHILDIPSNSNGPKTDKEGALWLDRESGGDLKYKSNGKWELVNNNKLRITNEILNNDEPVDPVAGQLWINKGILMYHPNDGSAKWQPIKALNIDNSALTMSFQDFISLPNNLPNGDIVLDNNIKMLQYLTPSEALDKFFINSILADPKDYKVLNDVAIQFPITLLGNNDKAPIGTIHVNPRRLNNINKRVFFCNPTFKKIYVPKENTEFYGFSKINNSLGRLLLEGTDYTLISNGIELSDEAAAENSFIITITYTFTSSKSEGFLTKGTIDLTNSDNNNIYIGSVIGDFLVYINGYCLYKDKYSYDGNYVNFKEKFELPVYVITCSNRLDGTVLEEDNNGNGIINLPANYVKPLICISGETLDIKTSDGSITDNKWHIPYAKKDMNYSIIESNGRYISSGIVDQTVNGKPVILVSTSQFDKAYPLLFIDGIAISQDKIIINNGNITVNNLVLGQKYLLLKLNEDDILFNNISHFLSIPFKNKIDDSLLYIGGQLVCDLKAVATYSVPSEKTPGLDRQLKYSMTDDLNQKWYIYSQTDKKWYPFKEWGITNITDVSPSAIPIYIDNLIITMNNFITGYMTDTRSIDILQNFNKNLCAYYSYTFADSIQEPLLTYSITGDGSKTYKTYFRHIYTPGTNSISTWINGIRQYFDVDSPSIFETGNNEFTFPQEVNGNIFYVIEKPEYKEVLSCTREILTDENRIVGAFNSFRTKNLLFPGILKIFVNGVRQTSDSYMIIDPYTITFLDQRISKEKNIRILIEIRQDYNLKEITIPVRYKYQNYFNILKTEDNLPEEMLESKDFIMIYINGFAYGKEFEVEPGHGIRLTNNNITSKLGVDLLAEDFINNLMDYERWYKENNKAYTSNPQNDLITFEWR